MSERASEEFFIFLIFSFSRFSTSESRTITCLGFSGMRKDGRMGYGFYGWQNCNDWFAHEMD